MKNNTSLTTASVYFITNSATTYDGVKRKDFTIVPNSGYVDYVIDMSTLASWTGTIKQLRIDPVNPATGSGQTLNIDYVRLTN